MEGVAFGLIDAAAAAVAADGGGAEVGPGAGVGVVVCAATKEAEGARGGKELLEDEPDDEVEKGWVKPEPTDWYSGMLLSG